MIQMGDRVLVGGKLGDVIWIDPWDECTVAVQRANKSVEEVAIEDCVKVERVPVKVINGVKKLVNYLEFHMKGLLHTKDKKRNY